MPPVPPIAAPSILSADFSRLAEAVGILDPSRDWLHCDVMDHHFVPNLTFGPLIVAALDQLTTCTLDVHLMVEHPGRMLGEFRRAGADVLTVHLEACPDPGDVLRQIRALDARAGLALRPGTPFESAAPWLDQLDLLLVMTVEPGFGGQAFMPAMLEKVRSAAAARRERRLEFLIEVDGGIGSETGPLARRAGADVFVAGNAIYRHPDPAEALAGLRAGLDPG